MGHNTHEIFMSRLTKKTGLSQHYTNHCICVTGCTNLCRTGNFSAKQIMAVTGHKSIQSLGIYHRVKSDEKLMMGMSLSFNILKPSEVQSVKNAMRSQIIQPEQQNAEPTPVIEAHALDPH